MRIAASTHIPGVPSQLYRSPLATERLAIGVTLAMMLLVPPLLLLRMKAKMYLILDRAYPELARRLLRHEADRREKRRATSGPSGRDRQRRFRSQKTLPGAA
jgi:hypothetical protein